MAKKSGAMRLPTPASYKNRFFFHRVALPVVNQDDVSTLVEDIKEHLKRHPLNIGEVEIVSLSNVSSKVGEAMRRLEALPPGDEYNHASVLISNQAFPHTDPSFEGTAFLSQVLHTGPYPYVMTVMNQRKLDGIPDLAESTRILRVGDSFLFDPVFPHFALPARPHQDQLLVLLQWELEDREAGQRAELLKRYPPMPDDGQDALTLPEEH